MTDQPIETGLGGLTAAVTIAEETPVPAVVTVATVQPAAADLPGGWTIHRVFELVNELAQNLYEEPYYLKKYGLTQGQYDALKANEYFKKAFDRAVEDWNRPNNVNQRLALESAVGIESVLPTLIARAGKADEPLPGVVQLLKVLSEIAGTTGNANSRTPDAAGEKFKIVINLGADTFSAEKTANPVTVQSLSEGPSPDAALQRLTSGT